MKLKLPLKKISTIEKTIMEILFYTFEDPRSQYLEYDNLTNIEKEIISPEIFQKLKLWTYGKITLEDISRN